MPRGSFSKADREAVLADFRDTSLTIKAIAAKHGTSANTVSTWASAAGLSRPKGRPPAQADVRAVVEDWRDFDLTITAICRKHGIGYERVVAIAQQAGVLELRKGGRQGRRKHKDESDFVLTGGAWVYGRDGVGRWTPGATPQKQDGAA